MLPQDYRSEQPLHPEAGFSGREQVGENWALMFEEVPDLRLDPLRSAIAGDEVWTELRVHGRKVDGNSFEYRGMTVWGVRDSGQGTQAVSRNPFGPPPVLHRA